MTPLSHEHPLEVVPQHSSYEDAAEVVKEELAAVMKVLAIAPEFTAT